MQGVVGPFQLTKRLLQFAGPFADFAFQDDGGLKEGKGIALKVHAALDALHQDFVDLAQLGVFVFQSG
jgi:roadblock/LC7 domain-containing protein